MTPDASSESPQWYLEVNGRKFGPYTTAQVHTLAQQQEIIPEDRLISTIPGTQPITVQDFLDGRHTGEPNILTPAESSPAPAFDQDPSSLVSISIEAAAPEVSMPSLVVEIPTESPATEAQAPQQEEQQHHYAAAPVAPPPPATELAVVHDLFDILQAAKDRKPKQGSAVIAPGQQLGHSNPSSPQVVGGSNAAAGSLFRVVLMGVFGVAIACGALYYLAGRPSSTTVATPETAPEKTTAAAPAPHAPTPPRPAAPAAAKPASIPATELAHPQVTVKKPVPWSKLPIHERPANYTPTNDELDRAEKDREAEAEAKERDRQRDEDRDRDRERDRDRDNRDIRDRDGSTMSRDRDAFMDRNDRDARGGGDRDNRSSDPENQPPQPRKIPENELPDHIVPAPGMTPLTPEEIQQELGGQPNQQQQQPY